MNRNLPAIERFFDGLLARSTNDYPAWNIEVKKAGAASGWNYIDGCMILATLENWKITGNETYRAFAESYIGSRVSENGAIRGFDPEANNVDNVMEGRTLFALEDLTGDKKYGLAQKTIHAQFDHQPRCANGNFWHKDIYPNQVWLDGLYMAQPFRMEYEIRHEKDSEVIADIYRQFANVRENMRDSVTGLYYHAWDTSKSMYWADPQTGLSQNFWLRAMGWYSMALLDTLSLADPDIQPESFAALKANFVDVIESLLKFQDPSGMWYQVIDKGTWPKNYLETSGSSILSYCILKGVRLGYLPKEFQSAGLRAFDGVCDRYLTEEDGTLHLGGICLVAGLGGKTRRDGTYEYYMSEPIVQDDAKGVGPFLLAYTEVLRLQKEGLLD